MKIRLLIATPDSQTQLLLRSVLQAAMQMVPLDIQTREVCAKDALTKSIAAKQDDLLLLDWELVGAASPDYLRYLLAINPQLRIITLLPMQLRQYRQCIWEAGGCSGIPKERVDQEWLSSVLCIINRAMEREERVRASVVLKC